MNLRISSRALAGVFVASLVVLPSHPALAASCSQSSGAISQADQDWWNTHGCQPLYPFWQIGAYAIGADDWSGHGYSHWCTLKYDFAKIWGSSYLVNYGLSDTGAYFHHSQADYRPLAEAAESNFHESHEYFPPDTSITGFGLFAYDYVGADNIYFGCSLYDKALSANANPASRAGDFMHESWHGWQETYGWDGGPSNGHLAGPVGGCSISDCDNFYFHKHTLFPPGTLYQTLIIGNKGVKFHSPNQIQVEFLCDVNQYPAPNVPMSVRNAAKSDADARAAKRFKNGPGYKCGDPRPW